MSGYGTSGSGIGPAGHDPVSAPSDQVVRTLPLALHFDPSTGDATMLSTGRLQADHPVDAWMDLTFSVRRGSLRSSPDVGHTLGEIRYQTATLEADVKDRINSAVSARVKAGDLRIDSIQVVRQQFGFVAITTYTNLRLASQPSRAVRSVI
jgi:hypothetical protein